MEQLQPDRGPLRSRFAALPTWAGLPASRHAGQPRVPAKSGFAHSTCASFRSLTPSLCNTNGIAALRDDNLHPGAVGIGFEESHILRFRNAVFQLNPGQKLLSTRFAHHPFHLYMIGLGNFKRRMGGGNPLQVMKRPMTENQEYTIMTCFLDFKQIANSLMILGN